MTWPKRDETRLRVTGMTCGNCAGHVRAALLAVPGVKAADVDHEAGAATIKHKAVPNEALVAAVVAAGYAAEAAPGRAN